LDKILVTAVFNLFLLTCFDSLIAIAMASVALAEEAPAAAVLVVVGNCIGKIYIKNGSASFEGTPIFM
jgi:hypothetical protein